MNKFNINFLNDVFCTIKSFFFNADKVYQCFAL